MLIQLNEWQNFEAYHQSAVNTALMSTWRIRQNLEKLFEEEARSDRAASNPEVQSNISTWLERLFPRQKDLDSSQKQLTIIESQAFEIISEACDSFEDTPLLCQQLEKKLEEQTNAVYQDLVLLGARPTCAAQASSPTAPYIQRTLHWKSETSRLLKERREWRMFLKWRKNPANANMLVATEGNQSNGRHMDSALWRDYVTYRQNQVNKAKSWIICWQRLKRSSEKQVEQLTKAGLLCFGGSAASIQRYVERFQEDVRTAEGRLRSAQQQLAEFFVQQSPSAAHEMAQQSSKCTQLPPSPTNADLSESNSNNGRHEISRTSPTKAHRPPPTHAIPESIYPSSIPCQQGESQANHDITDQRQLIAVTSVAVSDQVKIDDDMQMTDAPDHSYTHEGIGDKIEECTDTPLSGTEDVLMVDVENIVSTSSPPASKVESKDRGTRGRRNSRLPVHQVPTTRQTRSATRLKQAISGKVLKNKDKKPVKKVKTFTEQQTMALVNAASDKPSTTGPIPLRRSERLKEKAAASVIVPAPELKVAQVARPSQSSGQKGHKKLHSSFDPYQPPKHKKAKIQSNILESSQSSRIRKSRRNARD